MAFPAAYGLTHIIPFRHCDLFLNILRYHAGQNLVRDGSDVARTLELEGLHVAPRVSMVGRKGLATPGSSYIRDGIVPAPRRDVVHGFVEAHDDIFAGVLVELVQCRVEVGRFRHVVRMCVMSEE